MPAQTEHRFPLGLSVLDAAGGRVTLADLRGQARAVAVYFMGTGWIYLPAARGRRRWYPDRRRTPPGSGASSATGSPPCPPTAPRRIWRLDSTGPCSFNTAAS